MSVHLRLLATAAFLGFWVAVPSPSPLTAQSIRLGDVTAGGEGTGTALLEYVGVDERTGRFATAFVDGPVFEGEALDDGLNPSPVPNSPYVDSVFFIEPGLPGLPAPSQVITLSGVRFDSPEVGKDHGESPGRSAAKDS